MPVVDKYARLAIADIIVPEGRQRTGEIDTSDLEPSIRRQGVIQPIVITAERVLVAGERRLLASKRLGLADIPIRFSEDLSETEHQIIELSENVKRQDLQWQDIVRAVGRLHGLFCQLDKDWTLGETANECSLSTGIISMYLKVHAHLGEDRVLKAGTVREAYNMLDRRDARAAGEALQEILDTTNDVVPHADSPQLLANPLTPLPDAKADPRAMPKIIPAEDTLLQANFLEWAPQYTGKKFNFIHCDFPYGVNLFSANGKTSGPQRSQMGQGDDTQVYDDNPEIYFALLKCLCDNLDRLMSASGHLMFWFSAKHRRETEAMFKALAPSLKFYQFDLVWIKSDNAGIASDVRHWPRHIYETAMLASRSSRQIVRIVSDAYNAPRDPRFHKSTKSEPMLKHFFSMLVDENTSLLDPTAGSASSIRAAEELGALRTLGLELDPETCQLARGALRAARTLRLASATVR